MRACVCVYVLAATRHIIIIHHGHVHALTPHTCDYTARRTLGPRSHTRAFMHFTYIVASKCARLCMRILALLMLGGKREHRGLTASCRLIHVCCCRAYVGISARISSATASANPL